MPRTCFSTDGHTQTPAAYVDPQQSCRPCALTGGVGAAVHTQWLPLSTAGVAGGRNWADAPAAGRRKASRRVWTGRQKPPAEVNAFACSRAHSRCVRRSSRRWRTAARITTCTSSALPRLSPVPCCTRAQSLAARVANFAGTLPCRRATHFLWHCKRV